MRTVSATVAANIRKLRAAQGLTQEAAARRLGEIDMDLSRDVLVNLETERRRAVTVDDLIALGALFGVEPWSLTSPFECPKCKGTPPAGYSCLTCGDRG